MKKALNIIGELVVSLIIFIAAACAVFLILNSANAFGQSSYIKLQTKETVTDTVKYLDWYMIDYPRTNISYWQAYTDTTKPAIRDGNTTIPQPIIDKWGTDDAVIYNYLISQKVWKNQNK